MAKKITLLVTYQYEYFILFFICFSGPILQILGPFFSGLLFTGLIIIFNVNHGSSIDVKFFTTPIFCSFDIYANLLNVPYTFAYL